MCPLVAFRFPGDPRHPSVRPVDVRHLHALGDGDTLPAGAGGQGKGDVGRIALTVQGKMDGADDILDVEPGIEIPRFTGRDLVDLDAEGSGERGRAGDLLEALAGKSHGDGAVLAHAGGDTGLLLEPDVEVRRILRQPRHVLTRPQLAHQPCGMPRGARGQLLSLEENDVLPAELGEMVGNRRTRHATTDDDGAGLARKVLHGPGSFSERLSGSKRG